MLGSVTAGAADVRSYLPRLAIQWLSQTPDRTWNEIDASVVFADIAGFTKMSERLARRGKIGAEEVADVIGSVFSEMLIGAYAHDGGLLKFGGDALLLMFRGRDHAERAALSACGMRTILRGIGPIDTSAGKISLRMTVGVHTGLFHLFMVGGSHRELLMTGPATTRTVEAEAIAETGEIVATLDIAAHLRKGLIGERRDGGVLVRGTHRPTKSVVVASSQVPMHYDLMDTIPVALRPRMLAGETDPEHRRVTTAFVRFAGTDAIIESSGTAAAAEALDELVRTIQRSCDRHAVTFLGTDVDRDGGKILLVAGAPVATGEEEERMLLALREIRDAGTRIPIRAGVTTGYVFAGDVGPPYRRTYTVIGDTVNLAARVMARAEPGQVLATDDLLARPDVAFAATALEPFTVKGKKSAVRASIVGDPAELYAPSRDDDLPLVGRANEVGQLVERLASASAGSGSLVEIVGPPGIGKTRLLGEVLAVTGEARVLRLQCDLYSASTPYLPVRDLLLQTFNLARAATDTEIAEALTAAVGRVAPELEPWIPLLGVPLDVEIAPTPEVAALGEDFRRTRLEQSVDLLLERLLPGPSVIAIEDAHWMDQASGDMLIELSRGLAERPWLVCLTRRDEATGFVPDSAALSLWPNTLNDDEMHELLVAATEHTPLRSHHMLALSERSGGNPLFLKELLAASLQAGSTDHLPDTIDATVAAEIDRLDRNDRRVLRYASVLGMRFDGAALATLVGDEASVSRARFGRLSTFLAPDSGGWRFRHALSRDVAYEGLSYRRRRELHARAGDALETDDPDDADLGLLALHFFHAGELDKTWRYASRAAVSATSKFALVDAIEHYERAVESARRLGTIPHGELAETLEALGDLCGRVGHYEEAGDAYRAARRLVAANPVILGDLYRKHSYLAERTGSYPQALRWVRRGMSAIESRDDLESRKLQSRLIARYGLIRLAQGRRLEAVRWLNQAIAAATAADEKEALAHAYISLDWALIELGRPQEAVYSQVALDILGQLGQLATQATVYNNMGVFAGWQGRWNDAVQLYEKATALWLRIGDTVDAADGMVNIGEVLSDQGHLQEAERLFHDSLRTLRAAGYAEGKAWALSYLGRAACRSGDHERGMQLYADAQELFKQLGATSELIEIDSRIAESLVLQGRSPEAIELATDALARLAALGGGILEPTLQRVRGWGLLQLDDLDGASEAFELALESARARDGRYEIALTQQARSALAEIRDGAPDPVADREADEILGQLGVGFVPGISRERTPHPS